MTILNKNNSLLISQNRLNKFIRLFQSIIIYLSKFVLKKLIC